MCWSVCVIVSCPRSSYSEKREVWTRPTTLSVHTDMRLNAQAMLHRNSEPPSCETVGGWAEQSYPLFLDRRSPTQVCIHINTMWQAHDSIRATLSFGTVTWNSLGAAHYFGTYAL